MNEYYKIQMTHNNLSDNKKHHVVPLPVHQSVICF